MSIIGQDADIDLAILHLLGSPSDIVVPADREAQAHLHAPKVKESSSIMARTKPITLAIFTFGTLLGAGKVLAQDAKILGMGRTTLYMKMKKYGIALGSWRPAPSLGWATPR